VLAAGEAEDEARAGGGCGGGHRRGRAVLVVQVGGHGAGGDDGAEGPVLATAGANGDVAKRAAGGPVAVAVLAEVARLVDVVVVEVAELGVPAPAARARQRRRRRGRRGRARLRGVLVLLLLPRARVLLLPFALPALGRPAAGVLLLLDEVVVRRRRLPLDHRLVPLVRVVPLPRAPRRRLLLLRRHRRGALGALRDDLAEELEPAGRGGHLDVGQHPNRLGSKEPSREGTLARERTGWS
jgi:hypothetical protein